MQLIFVSLLEEIKAVDLNVNQHNLDVDNNDEDKNESSDEEDKAPDEYKCPITLEIMRDPVKAADGISYERSSIEEWLESSDLSPYHGNRLPNRTLITDHNLRNLIQRYQASVPLPNPNFPNNRAVSKMNPHYHFDLSQFVLSVINYKKHSSFLGHAFLLLEGLVINPTTRSIIRLVGQYDIDVTISSNKKYGFYTSVTNSTGTIREVRVHESEDYNHPAEDRFYNSPHRSFLISEINARKMIANIKTEARLVQESVNGRAEPLQFQMYGTKGGLLQKLFSDSQGGVNCAEWCMKKMDIAGISLDVNPKPKRVVQEDNSRTCLMM